MLSKKLSRRRVLTITAAAVLAASPAALRAADQFVWHGPVLGGEGKLVFHGLSERAARQLAGRAIAEIDRLEQVFSLHRENSEICRLNRTGIIRQPTHDLQVVLTTALEMWRRSDRAFNPAIQPLWRMLAGHFSAALDGAGPDPAVLSSVLELCDPAGIEATADEIRLAPGMALTLNGIAQGYIADQVTELLKAEGLRDTLVQLGETRALPGRGWPMGIEGSSRRFTLHNAAVATSAGEASLFTPDGRWHHLIDPRTGLCRSVTTSVTVVAPTALIADAVSTALSVCSVDAMDRIARSCGAATAVVRYGNGRIVQLAGELDWHEGGKS